MTAALLTPDAMAERLGVPVSTVMEWNRAKKWPHVRVGRRYRWTEEQYAEIVRGQIVVPKKGAEVSALPGQTARSAARGRAS